MPQPPRSRTSRPLPASGDRPEAERQARLAREAVALRENLRRRKQQVRAREDGPTDAAPPAIPPGRDPT